MQPQALTPSLPKLRRPEQTVIKEAAQWALELLRQSLMEHIQDRETLIVAIGEGRWTAMMTDWVELWVDCAILSGLDPVALVNSYKPVCGASWPEFALQVIANATARGGQQ
jgi:hypothetical protein